MLILIIVLEFIYKIDNGVVICELFCGFLEECFVVRWKVGFDCDLGNESVGFGIS